MRYAIIIPARYGSTRFPGKPLVHLKGKPILQWTIEAAQTAAQVIGETAVYVATDDTRIAEICPAIGVTALMTPESCANGTARVHHAALSLPKSQQPEIVLNLQGDAPLTPPQHLIALLAFLRDYPEASMATPAVQLSWESLHRLRIAKQTTPFSGTTVTFDAQQRALWFSKNILPAIRKEDRSQPLSPVYQHIGLYGYRLPFLSQYTQWPESFYERLEGLEQLRVLENGSSIHIVPVEAQGDAIGIDSPEDLARAEAILQEKANLSK
jgi:3-deoxy-manno-octulosonate cytidylyltransferase (CMP-KDO synthetase)